MIKNLLKFFYWFFYKKSNFSQSDEEQILNELFNKTKKGFYVDVGCHHPRRYSNTALLYNKGWHGVNIDADKKNLKLFRLFRKRDKNIQALISDKSDKLKFYYFDDSALNGILNYSKVRSLKDLGYKVLKEEFINTQRLDDVISKFEIPNNRIDFLDIDVEGYDFQVLKSIDLNLFEIKAILVETGDFENEITEYLLKHNYIFYKKSDRNSFFIKDFK